MTRIFLSIALLILLIALLCATMICDVPPAVEDTVPFKETRGKEHGDPNFSEKIFNRLYTRPL